MKQSNNMKNIKRIIAILSLTICLTVPLSVFSQAGPPPPPNHNSEGNTQGAPIGGGLFILLGLGAAYGGVKGYKFYKLKKKSLLD